MGISITTTHHIRELLAVLGFLAAFAATARSAELGGELKLIDKGYDKQGEILLNPVADTNPEAGEAIYHFRANDWSMIEPLAINADVSEIQPDGTFTLRASYPDNARILYDPLSGNERELIVSLDSMVLDGVTYTSSLSDTLIPDTHIGRGRFVRPDGIGVVYPNPASGGSIQVEFETDSPGEIRLDFITSDGRSVRGKTVTVKDKGLNTYTLELPANLASGNYMFVLISRYGRSYQLVSYRK